ncbi:MULTISPECIES: metal ABC transporter permease [Croceibacter]|jgi:manganese/zinc/iron transport system permease protein|uniref:Zinc ABC transporter, permease protein n=1 Tax=Croceibacter atlanticus (strain ATCC BAA-628 / JCM 21780 / CIP 108009 / IAM 15332 / KCTC 12090 / HTCC2559) TaxID=216432 RepID=A3U5I2_CROAH|nr:MULTISPECIES: metal ABC transporter permease [Croceibacter]EAP87499.1 zinc ABC transporter, permease protein [Croceibacter atlanticus HTCC2559]MBG25963.1 metal ABC transporter permease [Croceibacter sp.]MBW4970267.1 metal ABC transporter permease [Croceibacter atlanticus]|tara:strand:- start:135 stop:1295 length:1161 start_codon:yes stop_codon:yes gene_type:complete
MSSAQIDIQLIAMLVALACAIPGTFLVLRKMAMISDAISHSILPGIVLGFFITHDLNSPILILLAAFSGVITVFLVEFIQKTGLVKKDTAIGLVFPALFSIGVILIAKNANDVHLDIDAVLLGELAFAPFDRLLFNDIDLGPKSLWVIGTILLITITLLIMFFKELKLSTFDKGLAATLGFSPILIHYGLMTVSSITVVGAFDAVGAILVVALMIAPAASAYLLTNDLKKMLLLSCTFGVFAAISGYWLANLLDGSIAGSMTTMLGVIFLMVYFFAPNKGLISVMFRQKRQRKEVSLLTFLLHLQNHSEERERHVNHLQEHINWQKIRSKTVLDLALRNNMISIEKNIVTLTDKGQKFTERALEFIITNKTSEIELMKEDFFLFRG